MQLNATMSCIKKQNEQIYNTAECGNTMHKGGKVHRESSKIALLMNLAENNQVTVKVVKELKKLCSNSFYKLSY